MYAVIKAGGKQQRVQTGDVIEVELMHGQHDDRITFAPLMVVDNDGKAHVGKELGRAVVKAKLVGEKKGDKIKVFKYRPKSGYARSQGHRQMYTLVEIEDVSLGAHRVTKKEEAEPQAKDAVATGVGEEPEAAQAKAPDAKPEEAKAPEANPTGSRKRTKRAEEVEEAKG